MSKKNSKNELPAVGTIRAAFDVVNGDTEPVPYSDVEYYAEQITNLYGCGHKKAVKAAAVMAAFPTVLDSTNRAKNEVLDDVAPGAVPVTVASFGELHDYVDANCYAGFCEDTFADEMIEFYGGRDEHEGMPQGMLDHISAVQNAVDKWLRDGRMKKEGRMRRAIKSLKMDGITVAELYNYEWMVDEEARFTDEHSDRPQDTAATLKQALEEDMAANMDSGNDFIIDTYGNVFDAVEKFRS